VRVAPKLMAGARRSPRERGKSDVIDMIAITWAVLREGPDELPTARTPQIHLVHYVEKTTPGAPPGGH
jgi:hypothetical protein